MKIFKSMTEIAEVIHNQTGLPKSSAIDFVIGEEAYISASKVYQTGQLDMNRKYYNLAVGKVLDNYRNGKTSRKYLK